MQVDFRFLKLVPALKPNTEVDFRLCGRHLEKPIWQYNTPTDCPVRKNLEGWCKIKC